MSITLNEDYHTQKKALVLGAGGFIGGHLVRRLKSEGYWVRGVDIKHNPWMDTGADDFIIGDLRHVSVVDMALTLPGNEIFNEVYQLAADMGGALYIFTGEHDAEIMHNSATINLNVCEAVKNKFGKKCTLFYSSSACFTEDTPIFTLDGVKNIKDITLDDMVLTHTGQFKRVTKYIKSPYDGKIAHVKCQGLPEIKCTPNHPFFVYNMENKQDEWKKIEDFENIENVKIAKPIFPNNSTKIQIELPPNNLLYNKFKNDNPTNVSEWIKTNNIETPEYHVIRRWKAFDNYPKSLDSVTKNEIIINREFGELLGIYLAEGWCEKTAYATKDNPDEILTSKRIVFAFGEEQELINRTKHLLLSVFGIPENKFCIYKIKNQEGYKLHVTSDVLYNFFSKYAYPAGLEHNQRNCYTKQIHQDLLINNTEYLKGIVDGFNKGDGCKQMNNDEGRKNGRYCWCSTSVNLIHQIREILLSLDIYTSFQIRENKPTTEINGRTVSQTTSYNIYTVGHTSLSNANNIMKQIENDKIIFYTSNNTTEISNNFYVKTKSITFTDFSGFVYNMEVEDDHSYTVYGLSVHNCMYPAYNQEDPDNPNCSEESAYPAFPDSEYGWEKLFSERMYLAYNRNYGLDVRVARFHNIFGPHGSWNCGREKAPAALCRKVAMAQDGGEIEVIGDGKQTRSFLFIDECIEGVRRLMKQSVFLGPVNIGSEEMVSIGQFADMIIKLSGKNISIKYIPGPTGVKGRNSDNKLIAEKLNWKPSLPLIEGLKKTYIWISQQIADGIPDYQYE